jgi:hypothetical protein
MITVGCLTSGCSDSRNFTSFYHEVIVPLQYRSGRLVFAIRSDQERYIQRYEDGWWECIKRHLHDINDIQTEDTITTSGWGVEISGFYDGYHDCRLRILNMIAHLGVKKTVNLLQVTWNAQ